MILITGHKGFIGLYLSKDIEHIGLDIRDGNDILNCELPDADVVIHLAGQTDVMNSVDDPENDAINNIIGTIRLAKRYKKSKFIFISSGGTIQKTIESPYGLSKFCAEEYVKLICEDYIILRFPNIYGKGSRSVVDKFIDGDVNIYGDGSAIRNYVHVSDIVNAIKESINWESGTYSLGYPNNYSVLELANCTNKKITFLPERNGELNISIVENNSNWKPKINVLDYLKEWT